jgi:excinuclease UvrABC nuclease subunit
MSWAQMDKAARTSIQELQKRDIPNSPGVYALYREGERMYIGKATSLRSRIGGQHGGKGASMTNSALRRNICQLLEIASAANIKAGRYRTTSADAGRVSDWLQGCAFAWIECASPVDALALETSMRAEFKPPLNQLLGAEAVTRIKPQ